MSIVTLKTPAQPLYQIQPQHSHPKLSLTRVLWVKFIRWMDKASFEAIRKIFLRVGMSVTLLIGIMAPQFLLGFLTATLKWNSFRIPIFFTSLALLLNMKRCWLFMRRSRVKRSGNNQHTFHGVPVGEFATWLMEVGAFKRDEAMSKWAFSQGQYAKIAAELEQQGILCRGENNSRVLREITMENLVLQLRDDYPLVWSDERQVWAERNGTFERWALSQDFKRRKLEEDTARRERKLERIEKKIEQSNDVFANLFAHSPQTVE